MSGYMRAKWKKWDVLDRAIQEEGWKLLLLLRLSPAVPYNVLNIAMALTGMNFWVFTITSFFGEGMDKQGVAALCGVGLRLLALSSHTWIDAGTLLMLRAAASCMSSLWHRSQGPAKHLGSRLQVAVLKQLLQVMHNPAEEGSSLLLPAVCFSPALLPVEASHDCCRHLIKRYIASSPLECSNL